jgi:hypothetical protein
VDGRVGVDDRADVGGAEGADQRTGSSHALFLVDKNDGPARCGPFKRLPKVEMISYLFFEDFLPPFFDAAFFFVAIKLTTFHAVRDLTVASFWQFAPDRSSTT